MSHAGGGLDQAALAASLAAGLASTAEAEQVCVDDDEDGPGWTVGQVLMQASNPTR